MSNYHRRPGDDLISPSFSNLTYIMANTNLNTTLADSPWQLSETTLNGITSSAYFREATAALTNGMRARDMDSSFRRTPFTSISTASAHDSTTISNSSLFRDSHVFYDQDHYLRKSVKEDILRQVYSTDSDTTLSLGEEKMVNLLITYIKSIHDALSTEIKNAKIYTYETRAKSRKYNETGQLLSFLEGLRKRLSETRVDPSYENYMKCFFTIREWDESLFSTFPNYTRNFCILPHIEGDPAKNTANLDRAVNRLVVSHPDIKRHLLQFEGVGKKGYLTTQGLRVPTYEANSPNGTNRIVVLEFGVTYVKYGESTLNEK